jgi:hypothetical protein
LISPESHRTLQEAVEASVGGGQAHPVRASAGGLAA